MTGHYCGLNKKAMERYLVNFFANPQHLKSKLAGIQDPLGIKNCKDARKWRRAVFFWNRIVTIRTHELRALPCQ